MAELLERPCQQNERTDCGRAFALLSLELTAFCFFFPAGADVREENARACFHGGSLRLLLKPRPEGGPGDEGRERAGETEGAGGGRRELREMEPSELLCDCELAYTRVG